MAAAAGRAILTDRMGSWLAGRQEPTPPNLLTSVTAERDADGAYCRYAV